MHMATCMQHQLQHNNEQLMLSESHTQIKSGCSSSSDSLGEGHDAFFSLSNLCFKLCRLKFEGCCSCLAAGRDDGMDRVFGTYSGSITWKLRHDSILQSVMMRTSVAKDSLHCTRYSHVREYELESCISCNFMHIHTQTLLLPPFPLSLLLLNVLPIDYVGKDLSCHILEYTRTHTHTHTHTLQTHTHARAHTHTHTHTHTHRVLHTYFETTIHSSC